MRKNESTFSPNLPRDRLGVDVLAVKGKQQSCGGEGVLNILPVGGKE